MAIKIVRCSVCTTEMEISNHSKSGICEDCVRDSVAPPEQPKPVVRLSVDERKERKAARAIRKAEREAAKATRPRGRGQGWHKKKLVEIDGQWYSRGREITPEEAERIRNAKESVVSVVKTSGRGQGWHKKVLFEWGGEFYSRGIKITPEEAKVIKAGLEVAVS